MGNFVSFPIDVKNEAVDLPFVAVKDQAWLESQNIQLWMPMQSNPVVDLHLKPNPDGTYIPISSWNGGVV